VSVAEAHEHLPPELWLAYAQARRLRAASDVAPSVGVLAELARSAGADPWALLLLVRGELPERGQRLCRARKAERLTGKLVSVLRGAVYGRPAAVVPTAQAAWACVLAEDRLYAHLYDPWDRQLFPRGRSAADLIAWAREWSRPPSPGTVPAPAVLLVNEPTAEGKEAADVR